MVKARLSDLIAPSFYGIYEDIDRARHTHYYIKGGRGSTKSSFVSLMINLGMLKDENANCVVVRKIGTYLKDSVYSQLLWAQEALGISDRWQCKLSPMEMIYIPTGQKILFRGADKPRKLKSTKVNKGYIKFIWYEECDEFLGVDEIRTINQSLMRGGDKILVFYTYNPPKSQRSWVNSEVTKEEPDKFVHHSTYLDVPREWLGENFIIEAERLERTNNAAYQHEYMGEVTGTGGEIFTNVRAHTFGDEEIAGFDRIRRGVDFGYATDPFVYIVLHYDKKHKRVYIFDEIYKTGLSNERAAQEIKERGNYRQVIACDSAEPKSIAELRLYGLGTKGVKKGRDSVEYGIKFLQGMEEIAIDPVRCPNTYREFYNYELEADGNGGFRDCYPDKNNHTIDAVRYALEDDMTSKAGVVLERKEWSF